jgi:inner membrane protein
MASLIGHAVVAGALGTLMLDPEERWAVRLVGVGLAGLPDLDVLAFPLGIPYAHAWGHRGATHSALMAVLLGLGAQALLRSARTPRGRLGPYLILATLSHGLLDMATSGGLGVALAWPFSQGRWFWPWRPIRVSPIGLGPFLGVRGLRVLASEALWIGIPSMVMVVLGRFARSGRDGLKATG